MAKRITMAAGQPTNWHLGLKNVQVCPKCRRRVAMPCVECRAKEWRVSQKLQKEMEALRA